jgi:hypothetical protein
VQPIMLQRRFSRPETDLQSGHADPVFSAEILYPLSVSFTT